MDGSSALSPRPVFSLSQTDRTRSHLDWVFLALEASVAIRAEDVIEAAAALDLVVTLSEWIGLWRLRGANPLGWEVARSKHLPAAEVQALVKVAAYLAQQNQLKIRQVVSAAVDNRTDNLVSAYLEVFCHLHGGPTEEAVPLALQILVKLLFYGGPQGAEYLQQDLQSWPGQSG